MVLQPWVPVTNADSQDAASVILFSKLGGPEGSAFLSWAPGGWDKGICYPWTLIISKAPPRSGFYEPLLLFSHFKLLYQLMRHICYHIVKLVSDFISSTFLGFQVSSFQCKHPHSRVLSVQTLKRPACFLFDPGGRRRTRQPWKPVSEQWLQTENELMWY